MTSTIVQYPPLEKATSDFWPTIDLHTAVTRLIDNVPQSVPTIDYSYVFKPVLDNGVNAAITLVRHTPEDVAVLVNQTGSITTIIKAWHRRFERKLKKVMTTNGVMSLVGQFGEKDGEPTFLLHYVVSDGTIFLDEVSLRKLTSGGEFGAELFLIPSTDVQTLHINKVSRRASFPFVINLEDNLTVIGLPVIKSEARPNGGATIHTSSPTHMRMMAFIHNTAQHKLSLT